REGKIRKEERKKGRKEEKKDKKKNLVLSGPPQAGRIEGRATKPARAGAARHPAPAARSRPRHARLAKRGKITYRSRSPFPPGSPAHAARRPRHRLSRPRGPGRALPHPRLPRRRLRPGPRRRA